VVGPVVASRGNSVAFSQASAGTLENLIGQPQPLFLPNLGTVFNSGTSNTAAASVFDLSFIPHGTTITGATLTVSAAEWLETGNPLDVPRLNVTPYVAPTSVVTQSNIGDYTDIGGVFYTYSFPSTSGSSNLNITLDVTSYIQSFVTNGTPDAGFYLSVPGLSIIELPGNNLPALSITSPSFLTVPEPPGALLLALGLLGLSLGVGLWRWLTRLRARPAADAASCTALTPAPGGAV
jgi:hypothetical protein